jgi:hypothetical protein
MKKRDKEGMPGATFGVMEAVVMMLGVMTGLSATGNRFIVAIGLITAGLADAFANSVAFHVSQETETGRSQREVWRATFFTFIGTMVTVLIIIWPIIALPIKHAVIVSWAIGIVLLLLIGYFVSRITKNRSPYKLMIEYLAFGIIASVICYLLGRAVVYLSAGI